MNKDSFSFSSCSAEEFFDALHEAMKKAGCEDKKSCCNEAPGYDAEYVDRMKEAVAIAKDVRCLYIALQDEGGFTEQQAFKLLCIMIQSI